MPKPFKDKLLKVIQDIIDAKITITNKFVKINQHRNK